MTANPNDVINSSYRGYYRVDPHDRFSYTPRTDKENPYHQMRDIMDNALVTIYLLTIFAIGILAGRGIKNLHYYSVVNRSYGPLIIFATLSASFIGGGFSIGNAGKVFTFGIVNIIALWGFSLKEVLVATVIVPRMNNFPNAISVGDIMETNYGRPGKVISGIFSVMLCAGIVGAQ